MVALLRTPDVAIVRELGLLVKQAVMQNPFFRTRFFTLPQSIRSCGGKDDIRCCKHLQYEVSICDILRPKAQNYNLWLHPVCLSLFVLRPHSISPLPILGRNIRHNILRR